MDSAHGSTHAIDGLPEARALLATRGNLLLTGPEQVTSGILQSLRPVLRQPVWETEATTLSLPTTSTGTLIVRQSARLVAEDQVRLRQWIADQSLKPQLITITSEPLFPLVRRGEFLDTLYYMLNLVQMEWRTGQERPEPSA